MLNLVLPVNFMLTSLPRRTLATTKALEYKNFQGGSENGG